MKLRTPYQTQTLILRLGTLILALLATAIPIATALAQPQAPAAYTFAVEVKLTGEVSPGGLAVELRENNSLKVRQTEPQVGGGNDTSSSTTLPTRSYRLLWQTNAQDLELVFVAPSSTVNGTVSEDILLRYPLDAKGVAAGSYSIGLEFKSVKVKKDAQGQAQEAQYIVEWAGKPATVTRGLPDWVTAGTGTGTGINTITTTTTISSTVPTTSTSSITTTNQNNRDGQGQGQKGNAVAGRQITLVGWVIILVSLAIGLALCYNAAQVWRLPAKFKARLASRSGSGSRARKLATATTTATDGDGNEPVVPTGKDTDNTAKPKGKAKGKAAQSESESESQQPSKPQPQPQEEVEAEAEMEGWEAENITSRIQDLSLDNGAGAGVSGAETRTRTSRVRQEEQEGEGQLSAPTAPVPVPGTIISEAADGSLGNDELDDLWGEMTGDDEVGSDVDAAADAAASSSANVPSRSASSSDGSGGSSDAGSGDDDDNDTPPSPPTPPLPPRRKLLPFPLSPNYTNNNKKAPNGSSSSITAANGKTAPPPKRKNEGLLLMPTEVGRPGEGKTKGMGFSESSFEVEVCTLLERYGAEWLNAEEVRVHKQVSLVGLFRVMHAKATNEFSSSDLKYIQTTSLDMALEVKNNAETGVVDYLVVIEADGEYYHSSPEQQRKDAIKNRWVNHCKCPMVRVTHTNQLEAKLRQIGSIHGNKVRRVSSSSRGVQLIKKARNRADKYQSRNSA